MALFGRGMGRGFTPQLGGGGVLATGQVPPLPPGALNSKQDEFAGSKQGGTERVRSGGLWGGAFMRKNLPRTLQIIGAGLQDISDGGGANLAEFRQNEAEQSRYDAVQAAQGRSQKVEDEQRSQLERAISTLPPEQQAWARLNPEAFAQAMARAQAGGGWQSGQGYSHLWRPNQDGTVTLGDPLPLRPRQGVQYNAPDDEDWEEF